MGRDDRFDNVQGPVQTGDGVQMVAGRDQHIAHGDQYVAGRDQVVHHGPDPALLADLGSLRSAIDQLRLTAAEYAATANDLSAMEAAAQGDEVDRETLGEHLASLTGTLKEAGALAAAGSDLAHTLGKLARWLGPLGAAALALL